MLKLYKLHVNIRRLKLARRSSEEASLGNEIKDAGKTAETPGAGLGATTDSTVDASTAFNKKFLRRSPYDETRPSEKKLLDQIDVAKQEQQLIEQITKRLKLKYLALHTDERRNHTQIIILIKKLSMLLGYPQTAQLFKHDLHTNIRLFLSKYDSSHQYSRLT